jgi:hypothetical protein
VPSEPKPKQFVATAAFKHGNKSYAVGDPVDDRRVIDRLVRYGDRFIKAKRSKSPAVDTATNPPAESKEG